MVIKWCRNVRVVEIFYLMRGDKVCEWILCRCESTELNTRGVAEMEKDGCFGLNAS